MRVLQVVHSFPPAIGGVERHSYELCRSLHSFGEEVVVHTTGPKTQEDFLVKRHWGLKLPFFSSVVWMPFLVLRLAFEKADVFASHGYGALTPACTAFASLLARKPFVFTVHGYPQLKGGGGIAQRIYENTFGRLILWRAAKVIVVSREAEKHLHGKVDRKKLVYIPNGVDADAFVCPPFTAEGSISYVGRLDRDKQVGMLVNAMKGLEGEKLLVAGNDEGERAGLMKLAKELGVDAEFTQVEPKDVPRLYCKSKAVVLPSRYEGFSLVWLEAMAAGRPMFSTPVGEAPELFKQVYGDDAGKLLFKDEKELVEKLEYFLENEVEFQAIAEKAKKKVKKDYSWDAMARKTLEVYKSAL